MERQMERQTAAGGTIDAEEVARFSRVSSQWWNPHGPMAALHKFNPVRIAYVRDNCAAHFGRDTSRRDVLAGLRLLDIGCGGGLLCEPLARLGASVTGIDPSERNIAVAQGHAQASNVAIDYCAESAEALAATGANFDAVLAMEVVEHVVDVDTFVRLATGLVRPGVRVAVSPGRSPPSTVVRSR